MRKIKNVAILVVVVLTACNSVKNEYVVNGVILDGVDNGVFVHMSDYNDGVVIDSVKVVDGKFTFKGAVDEPKAVMLTSNRLYSSLILEKGVITVDMSKPNSATGTPLIEKYNEYISKNENLIKEINEKFMSIDKTLPESEIMEIRDALISEALAKLDEIPLSYLENHSNDILGALIFYSWMTNQAQPSVEKFNQYSKLVGENVMSFGPVKQIADYYNSLGRSAVGSPFIDFTIENGNKDGSSASLSDYVGKGKYVLVDFWASWCMPCRMEAPNIAEVYNKYKGDKFEVLGVAVMEKREVTLEAIEKEGYTWPQIIDAQNIPLELYGIQGIPHIILFGPDGTIVARDLRGSKLKNTVAEAMKN